MQVKCATWGIAFGRRVLGIVLLAAVLAYGAIDAAATSGDVDSVTEAACAAATTLAPPSGEAWASTRGRPGEPY